MADRLDVVRIQTTLASLRIETRHHSDDGAFFVLGWMIDERRFVFPASHRPQTPAQRSLSERAGSGGGRWGRRDPGPPHEGVHDE